MAKRVKVSRRGSKRLFRKTADKTKPVNVRPVLMRGGFRM